MKNKIKFDPIVIVVLLLTLTVILVTLIATLSFDRRKEPGVTTTKPIEFTYPDVSQAPSREDVTVSFHDLTRDETYKKDGIEYIYSVITYPVVEGGNFDATAKINTALYDFASNRVSIKTFEKNNAEDAYKRAERDGINFIQFEFITSLESVYVKDGYLSVVFKLKKTVGINEPAESLSTLCFDLLTGDAVDLSVFMNYDETSAFQYVKDIFTQNININPNNYYNDALESLPDLIDLNSFYFNESGLVLYFNPDIITPSVFGIHYFTIPYEKIGH